ncbi:hypothetical protein F4819DRAFT_509374 [Hypoxylon fuscum]|nr:hypothetical protein F4819DRAFT_509374 [Hypoxylon fuscum]
MCHDWYQEYTGCGHVSRKLINCPAHHKQQSLTKGFLGRLFHGGMNKQKDCGRVIPHYANPMPFCPECSIRDERLRAKYVGGGAFRVYRPVLVYDDDDDDDDDSFRRPFQGYREKRKEVSRRSLERSERYSPQCHSKSDHTAVNDKPSVWLPGLYSHPQSFARRETYGRAAAAAPPVSPTRPGKPSALRPHCSHKTREIERSHSSRETSDKSSTSHHTCHKAREGEKTQPKPKAYSKKVHKQSQTSVERTPTLRYHPPPIKPAKLESEYQYQHNGNHAGNELSIPRDAKPLPLLPRPTRHDSNAWSHERPYVSTHKLPPSTCPPAKPFHPIKTGDYPPLRRKPGQVYRTVSPRPPRPPPIPVPLPQYQVYLNALAFATEVVNIATSSGSERIAPRPKPRPKPPNPPKPPTPPNLPNPPNKKSFSQRVQEQNRSSALQSLGKAIGLRSPSPASDTSFVCEQSKQITTGRGQRPPSRSR